LRVFTVADLRTWLAPATPDFEADPPQPAARPATKRTSAAQRAIRNRLGDVATAVTLDKEKQVRRIALIGLTLLAATAAAAAASTGGLPHIGTPSMKTQPVYKGYYDHHIDTYLITDVSSKSQAKAMHVNYSAELKAVKGLPEQYFVRGRAAKGQLTIFGSQPGEADYNPLWEEVWLTWKKGVKPVLIGQDDQIDALEKKGKLTEKDAHIVLNAPILKVGKGG
jgi:hypothetical protein